MTRTTLAIFAALWLVASGDFEGLAEQGFTPRLYRAIRDFEQRKVSTFLANAYLAEQR